MENNKILFDCYKIGYSYKIWLYIIGWTKKWKGPNNFLSRFIKTLSLLIVLIMGLYIYRHLKTSKSLFF